MSGLELKVDKELIVPIVQEQIKLALAQQLNQNFEAVLAEMIQKTLKTKVDKKSGNPSTNSWGTEEFLTWLYRQAIYDATKEALTEVVEQYRPQIKEAIKRELATSVDNIANQAVQSILSQSNSVYRFKLDINLPEKE